jgi:hypothetical protein
MRAGLAEGADLTLPRFLEVMQQRGGKSLGAIRVSLGLASNFADVDRFLRSPPGSGTGRWRQSASSRSTTPTAA